MQIKAILKLLDIMLTGQALYLIGVAPLGIKF